MKSSRCLFCKQITGREDLQLTTEGAIFEEENFDLLIGGTDSIDFSLQGRESPV
jgi:hypothetical protein